MGLLSWLRGRTASQGSGSTLASRRERRAAARRRHQESGQPGWTKKDRHVNGPGSRQAADVAPGTPGHFGSVRTVRDD